MIYLYGHVAANEPETDVTGVVDAPVQVTSCGSAAAVFSEVPERDFSADAIEARMSDLDWIGRRGVEHERIVAFYVDRGGILPARLFTLFSSREALDADCAERGARVTERLREFAGLREWDVKVSCDMDRFAEHAARHSEELADMDRELAQVAAGRRYLMQRRRDELARSEARRVAADVAHGLLEDLGALARDVRQIEPPKSASAGELPVVLNAALLVVRERDDELASAVRARTSALEAEGFSVSFSGPWAPYRFLGDA